MDNVTSDTMKRQLTTSQLTDHQFYILKAFIKQFLPKTGTKRHHSGNELEFISAALNRLFARNFGFHLKPDQVLNAFQTLDYEIFNKTKEVDSKYIASKIYVEIDPTTLRELRSTTYGDNPRANQSSLQFKRQQQERIDSFKSSIPNA